MSIGITSDCSQYFSNLRVLAQSHEECHRIDRVPLLLLLSVKDALNQMNLLLSDVDHILWPQFGQLLKPPFFLSL